MEINSEHFPDSLVLRLSGDLRLWGHAEEAGRLATVLSSTDTLPEHVILNMSGVHHIDTTGIGSLVRVLIACTKRHVELRVVLPNGLAGEALKRVRVFASCPTFETEAAAIEARSPAALFF